MGSTFPGEHPNTECAPTNDAENRAPGHPSAKQLQAFGDALRNGRLV
jgi:hypothetical protein